MSLQWILGPSGSGKSYSLLSEAVRHGVSHPDQLHLVLVPDQFTMQTQRELVALSPNGGIMNIEALSFERLAYRVFDELGTDTSNVLEDTGKSLLLRKITNDLKDELAVLSSGVDKAGFIDELKSLFSEFAQYSITPDDLGAFLRAPNMGDVFYKRIADIQKIYRAYEEELAATYITSEQVLSLLSDILPRSVFLRGAYLVFDGYTGFTPVQKNLFVKMLALSDKVRVSVTMDSDSSRDERGMSGLFHMSREFLKSMERAANEAGVAVEEPEVLAETGGRRFVRGGMLAHLEANLFRRGASSMEESLWRGASDEILLLSFSDPKEELIYVADSIRQRINGDPSLRFRDFAVLCPDIEDYRYTISEIFAAYGIPLFVDARDVALRSAFVEFVSAIAHVYAADFSYESVMRLLKCGFFPIEEEDVDLLDNYLLASGFRGRKRLERIFDREVGGMTPEDLVRLNETRGVIMGAMEEGGWFEGQERVESFVRKLYAHIVYLDCEKQLWEEADCLEEAGETEAASRTGQIYPKVIDLLDKMVRLMGTVTVSAQDFESILNEGLSAIRIGVIPPSLDSVVFGDMERSRISRINTLYLVGMSDGRVPGRIAAGGLLLQSERERLLADTDIELAPTVRKRSFMQRFYIYLSLCRPEHSLVLSYPRTTGEGEEAGACYLYATIKELFPGMEIEKPDREELMLSSVSEDTLAERVADALRDYLKGALSKEKEETLFEWLSVLKSQDEDGFNRLLAAGGYVYRKADIPRVVMEAIHEGGLSVSASRLEQYAACAYSYFLRYTLRLMERKESAIDVADLGNLYHEGLERYSKKLSESGKDWFTIQQEESDALLVESIEETILSLKATRMLEQARETYILERMKRTLSRTVWSLTQQVRQGRFTPRRFEVSLAQLSRKPFSLSMEDGAELTLTGVIDRLDEYENEDTVFIKIIDYKSGSKEVKLSDVYEGLQLQLLLYMKAAGDAAGRKHPRKTIVPSAIFYYQVKDPMLLVKNKPAKEELSRMILKELRVKGLVCDDDEVLAALDEGLLEAKEQGRSYSSIVVPVSVKRDGGLSATSHALRREDFATLGNFVEKKAADFGREIMGGRVDKNPYRRSSGESGCDYCPYHSVCGMDTKLGGYSFRKLLEESNQDVVLELMRREI